MTMRKPTLGLLCGLGTVFLTGSTALAHGEATGIVKERMDLMKRIADSNKQLAPIFKGAIAYDSQTVREAASVMADHGGEAMTRLFPEGSLEMPTEALPTIWLEWEHFSALANDLSSYARALALAADNPRPEGGMPMAGEGMMDGGMMGQGMMGAGMMGGGAMGNGMMDGSGPSEAMLAGMPPDAAYMHVAWTCKACHQDFRLKKD